MTSRLQFGVVAAVAGRAHAAVAIARAWVARTFVEAGTGTAAAAGLPVPEPPDWT